MGMRTGVMLLWPAGQIKPNSALSPGPTPRRDIPPAAMVLGCLGKWNWRNPFTVGFAGTHLRVPSLRPAKGALPRLPVGTGGPAVGTGGPASGKEQVVFYSSGPGSDQGLTFDVYLSIGQAAAKSATLIFCVHAATATSYNNSRQPQHQKRASRDLASALAPRERLRHHHSKS